MNGFRSLPALLGAVVIATALTSGRSRADGSPGAGRAIFQGKCAICHRTTPAANSIGPSLFGAFGRTSGTAEGYRYSDAMASSRLLWNEESLSAYLKDPSAAVPGNKMKFPGVSAAGERADLVAYIRSLAPPQP